MFKSILSVSAYLTVVTIVMTLSYNNYVRYANGINKTVKPSYKLNIIYVFVFSGLMALYNLLITYLPGFGHYGGDRTNYYYDFMGRSTDWQGFNLYVRIFRFFSDNFIAFLIFTTFLYWIITFISYRKSSETTYLLLLYILSTNYISSTMVNYRQCFVNALAMLFFAIMLNENKPWKRYIPCIVISIIASSFHATGFILFPILLVFLIVERNKKSIRWFLIPIFIAFFFFEPLMLFVARTVESYIPRLANVIFNYFAENTIHVNEGSEFAFIKGAPYYALFALGLIKRKQVAPYYKNYDICLFLTAIGAIFFLSSIYSYWMSRYVEVFLFPMGMLFSMIYKHPSNRNRFIEGVVVVGGNFFFTLREMFLVFINYSGY